MLLLTCAGLGHNCSRVSGAQAFKEISASKTAKDALMQGVGDVLVSMVSNKICLDYL